MPTLVTDADLLAQLNAPDRAPVAANSRVWGDKEAESAGLYEPSGKPVTDPAILRQLEGDRAPVQITVTPLRDRMGQMQPPAAGSDELNAGLLNRAAAMTRGPEKSPAVQLDTDFSNVLPAATQGTNPNIDRYNGRLVSAETFQSDGGEILYRDPSTGQVVPTDSKTQVAIRDPKDGTVKVFSRSEDTNEGGLVGAARVLSPGLAAGAPTARPGIATPAAKSIQPLASDLMATAKPYYKAFRDEAGQIYLTAPMRNDIASRMRDALSRVNLTEEMAGAPARSAIKMMEGDAPMSLDELQRVKRMAGRGFNNNEKDARDAAAAISSEISRVIAEASKSAAQNLKSGDAIHSTAKSLQELQRRGEIAGLRTGRAGYGGNAVNSMRQVLSPIVEKAINGRTTGFRPDEIKAMRDIVEGTAATNILRGVGQLSPSKGILATAVGGATGGVTAVAGAGANKLAAILTSRQIDKLNELVAKRSPAYAQAVARAVARYEKAQSVFATNPAPNTLAGYLSASRALSAGLTRDGIQVTAGDLLRAIQGPGRGAADQDQPAVPGRPGE